MVRGWTQRAWRFVSSLLRINRVNVNCLSQRITFSSIVPAKSSSLRTTLPSAISSSKSKLWATALVIVLYTNRTSLTHFQQLIVVHLVDSYTLTLPSMYISALLLSLRAMLQLDLPHLNVLTKIDNLSNYNDLPFNLDYYTEVQDLSYLLPHLEAESSRLAGGKFSALNEAIVSLVEEFGLVAFETLAVEDKKSMMNLLRAIDRASGYAFGPAEGANDTVWTVAVREGMGVSDVRDVQERWLDAKDEYDDMEREELEEEARMRDAAHKAANGEPDDFDEDMEDSDSNEPIPDGGVKVHRRT